MEIESAVNADSALATAADSVLTNPLLGRYKHGLTADLTPRFYELVKRGIVYNAGTQSAVTFSAGLSATAVFTLFNPPASGVNLVLLDVGVAFSAAPAAGATVYLTGNFASGQTAPSATTPITVRNMKIGGTAGQGIAYSAATLTAAPIVIEPITSVVAASSITPVPVHREYAGLVIVPPTYYITLEASTAASAFCSWTWAELAV
jgi:hypothetical protein